MVEKVDCVEFERAFEVLLEEGEKLLQQIRQRGAEALLEGDHHFTDWANQRSRALDEALKTLRDFQKNVKIILHGRSAVPSSPQPAPRRRRRRGTGIPQSEYMTLILVELLEVGGRATTDAMRERLWHRFKDQLGPDDLAGQPSSPNVQVWWNRACWARNVLREQRLIKEDSPRGIWELTQKGREEAEKRRDELLRKAVEE